jgi:hypothetical protein
VRYFIDEAEAGQVPTTLADAAPDPFDLPIIYTNTLQFSGASPRRGLQFDTVGDMGRASRLMDGSKLDAIDGLTQATVEVVITLLAASDLGSRLFHVGDTSTESRFSLQARSTTELDFEWRGSTQEIGVWQVADLALAGRSVVHFVLDTPNADNQERGRLYVDGVRQSATIVGTNQNEAVTVGAGRYLVIGNRESGSRTARGTVHYAAIYTSTLTDAEIASNAVSLLTRDDRR